MEPSGVSLQSWGEARYYKALVHWHAGIRKGKPSWRHRRYYGITEERARRIRHDVADTVALIKAAA